MSHLSPRTTQRSLGGIVVAAHTPEHEQQGMEHVGIFSLHRLLMASLLVAGGSLLAVGNAQAQSTREQLQQETRMPWARSDERFIREWLVLDLPVMGGNAFTSDWLVASGGEAAIHPNEATAHPLHNGTVRRWRRLASWADVVDLADGPGLKRELVGYAFTTIQRRETGKARLCLGSDEGISVWVNGALVLARRGPRPLNFDEDQVEITLNAGENTLLVKLEQHTGPWTFAARVLESGAIVRPAKEIAPALFEAPGSQLIVKTDVHERHLSGAAVLVEAIGAGGILRAGETVARGSQVRFDTTSWPDGAYEIRCETRTLEGARVATHLPWYRGDALAAARALVSAAALADRTDAVGTTTAMLAEMVIDRLGGSLEGHADNPWWAVHSPLMEFEELQLESRGHVTARKRPYGFVRLAWLDGIDEGPQFCRTYLPPAYTSTKRWPLVVRLHGFNPRNPDYINWWLADARHSAADAEYGNNEGIIVLEPHGRGNSSYLGMGQQDVIRAIKLAQEQFSVDPDRIYLCGDSMGGFGTWSIASRHPDLFAAIAPIFGGSDYHSWLAEDQLASLGSLNRFILEQSASWSMAESLLNLPITIYHGDADPVVPVNFSRYGARLLQRWGYNIRYVERPGYAHEDLDQEPEMFRWLLTQRRNANPWRIRLRTAELQHASAYWATLEQMERPGAFMMLDTEVVGKNLIRVDTQNVQGLTLSLSTPWVDDTKPVSIVWNGVPHSVAANGGNYHLRHPGFQPASGNKNSRIAGPLRDVLNTPFAIVMGTRSRDAAMNDACRNQAATLATYWQAWQHQRPRVFTDTEISEADIARYSLILIGGAEANLLSRRIVERELAGPLPLVSEVSGIRVGDRLVTGSDLRVQAVTASPFNSDRYVVVIAGTSPAGLAKWTPDELRYAEFDFTIAGAEMAERTNTYQLLPIGPIRGWFNHAWQVDPALIVP